MIPLPFVKDKIVAVVGLGKSGRATVRALRASGAQVVVWDDNSTRRSDFLAKRQTHVTVEPPQQWRWEVIDMLVLSPGIPLTHPKPHASVTLAHAHGIEIIGDIELLYRACPNATYIGITGTNGKSTTTSLIGHILEATDTQIQVGGNLGEPVLAMKPLDEKGIYVLELSSYQLDLVRSTVFDVAVLLNLSEDHLDRHGDMAGYMAVKQRIFDRQGSDDVAIIGVDDAYCEGLARAMIDSSVQQVIPIGTTQTIGNGIYVKGDMLHNRLDEVSADICDIPTLRGTHNYQNAAAAYAACRAVDVAHEKIIASMHSYPGLAHRMQYLGEVNGIVFVNDSKATNADAAAKALDSYTHIFWIAGGVAKEGGITSLVPYFPRIIHAFLMGNATEEFAQTLDGQIQYKQCDTLEKAFYAAVHAAQEAAMKLSQHTPVILMAPAAASFDQFDNFEQRGEVFMTLVEEYKNKEVAHAV